MSNSPKNDDIDVFVVTKPGTLWITRFITDLLLKLFNKRRDPLNKAHSSVVVSNKICDNLWLDADHLQVLDRSFYHAHEVLQTVPIFDRSNIHRAFLLQNNWVETYLPVAYSQKLKQTKLSMGLIKQVPLPVRLLNKYLYYLQRWYMSPKITSEKIGLGYAYFHPRSKKFHDPMIK
jgi:hypothetical protein